MDCITPVEFMKSPLIHAENRRKPGIARQVSFVAAQFRDLSLFKDTVLYG